MFFAYASVLLWRYVGIVSREHNAMTVIDLPCSLVYDSVSAAFADDAPLAIQVAVGNWRRGYSVLERPAAFDGLGSDGMLC